MLWRSGRRRERELAEALAASLDAMRSGSASLGDCLRRYPHLADELEPLLRTAAAAQLLSRLAPRDEARIAGRAAFMHAAARRSQPVPVVPIPIARRRPWVAFAPLGVAAALFAAIAVPVLGSMNTGSTPGDWNYGFKRATERIRLTLTTDPSERRLLRLEFAARRLDEIERLKATGHVASQRSDLLAAIHDYRVDLSQAAASAQSAGAIPSAQKDQFATVTSKATEVLTQVQQSVPASDPLNSAAQDAKTETGNAASAVSAVPTTTSRTASNQASPTLPPATTVAAPIVRQTPPAIATPPTAAPGESVTPGAPSTPSGSATVGAGGTPPATGTTSSTATAINVTATPPPTPSAVPTRVAPVLTPILPTPASAAASTPAPAPPTRTPAAPTPANGTPTIAAPASATPASATPGSVAPTTEPTALAANPTRTPLPAALAPLSGSASPAPDAEPTPARTVTPLAPTPVGTRAATVLPPVTGSTALVAGSNVFKYAGAPAGLDQIVGSLGDQLVVVWYVNAQQSSSSWYPGTPAPTIEPGAILTIVTRGPAVLAAPGTLLAAGR